MPGPILPLPSFIPEGSVWCQPVLHRARGLPAQARLPAVLSPGCPSVFTSAVFESLQPVTGDHQISLTTGTELSFKLLKQ